MLKVGHIGRLMLMVCFSRMLIMVSRLGLTTRRRRLVFLSRGMMVRFMIMTRVRVVVLGLMVGTRG